MMPDGINPEGFIESRNLEDGIELDNTDDSTDDTVSSLDEVIENTKADIFDTLDDSEEGDNIDEVLNDLDVEVNHNLNTFEMAEDIESNQLEAEFMAEDLNAGESVDEIDLDDFNGESEDGSLDDYDDAEFEGNALDDFDVEGDNSDIDDIDFDDLGNDDSGNDDFDFDVEASDDY